MRILALSLLLLLSAWLPVGAAGAGTELVMFESPGCPWCEAWDEEVGVVYHKTDAGRRAPLRRVMIEAPRPADLAQVNGVVYTPTFVLMHDGREIGRILGYPGDNHFWGLLDMILADLPAPES